VSGSPNIVPWGAPALEQGVAALWRGGVIIYPTETFYALGALPGRPRAIARLLGLKQRTPSPSKGLPLIAADLTAVDRIGPLGDAMRRLTDVHWPGPLTVCLTPEQAWHWRAVAAADGSVGVRISSHPAARALAAGAEPALLVATSANLSGTPPMRRLDALPPSLLEGVDLVIDAGDLPGGAPSTVVSADPEHGLRVLRPGAICVDSLARLAG
jgi:L-threonylcarbamoyladenylate synthase